MSKKQKGKHEGSGVKPASFHLNPVIFWVASDKLLNLFEPQFLHLQNESNNSNYLRVIWEGIICSTVLGTQRVCNT